MKNAYFLEMEQDTGIDRKFYDFHFPLCKNVRNQKTYLENVEEIYALLIIYISGCSELCSKLRID